MTVPRALSLLELIASIAMLGLLAVAATTFLGSSTTGNAGAEGFARKLAIALVHARRSTISTGDNHYLSFTSADGSIVSFSLMRRTSGGDVQVDDTRAVPEGVTITSAQSTLEFDFEGSALSAYSITVAGPDRTWVVSVVQLTGTTQVTETTT